MVEITMEENKMFADNEEALKIIQYKQLISFKQHRTDQQSEVKVLTDEDNSSSVLKKPAGDLFTQLRSKCIHLSRFPKYFPCVHN